MSDGYWTWACYEDGGFAGEAYDTQEQAEQAAREWHIEYVLDNWEPENGEKFEEEYFVVYMEPLHIEYEHYHGDLKEHGLTTRDVL